MGLISTSITVGLAKGLAKLLVSSADGGVLAESVASEMAGAAVKRKVDESLAALVARYVGIVEEHPEFRGIPDNDREAVKLEVEQGLAHALDPAFLAKYGFDPARIISAIYQLQGHKGDPKDFSAVCVALYQRVMDGAVGAVLVIRESAKGWKTTEAKAVQGRFDELFQALNAECEAREKINNTLGLLERTIADLASKEYRTQRDFLDLYLRAIRTTLDSMELFGLEIDPKTRAKEQRLSVAYITLSLKEDNANASETSRSWPETLNSLSPGTKTRLLVRGDAGMGKTTLLRWVAIAAASPLTGGTTPKRLLRFGSLFLQTFVSRKTKGKDRAAVHTRGGFPDESTVIKTAADSWREKIPLLIILRDCKEGQFPKPREFPSQLCAAVGDPPERFIEWLLDQGKAMVMIDGFDEVPPGSPRDTINKGIADLLKVYGDRGNLFVVTSRPMEDEPGWIRAHDFIIADISPMTRSDRDSLVRKWHSAYAAQLPTEEERSAIANKADVLIRELDARPAVARVATTPLLCAMLCAQCGALNYTLPGSEWHIIEGLCHALLWRRDKERALPLTGTVWDDLEYAQRRDIAARLARFMVDENKAVVDAQTANTKLANGLTWVGRDKTKVAAEAKIIRERLSARGGILRITKSGALEFVHNTFKEFLAASVFASEINVDFLATNAAREDCSNVCRFAAACGNPSYAKQLIEALLERKDHEPARKLIAVRMTAAASSLDPTVRERVKKIEKGMFPPKNNAACKALAELGNEVLDKLRFSLGMSVQAQIMCVNTLARIATPEARSAMQVYAPVAEDLLLIEQLSRGISPLEVPLVRRALLTPRGKSRIYLPTEVKRQINDAGMIKWLRADREVGSATALSLFETQVTDAGLIELANPDTGLKFLTMLELDGTQATDAGLKELARADTALKSLTTLVLISSKVTDAGLKEIARPDTGLKSLTSLTLQSTQTTDAGLKELARTDSGIRSLTTLNLYGTQSTDAGMTELARADTGLKSLTTLSLFSSKVTDAGLKELARAGTGLRSLTSLSLSGTQVTDAGLKELASADTGFKSLTTLELEGNQATDAGLKELSRADTGLKSLTTLNLYEAKVTDAGLKELARTDSGLKSLTTLSLQSAQVTDSGLKELARADTSLESLTTLNLYETQTTDAGFAELSRVDTGLKSLTTLAVFSQGLTDAGLKELARADTGLKFLTTLTVFGRKVSDKGLKELASANMGLKFLTKLSVYGAQVTEAGVRALEKAKPGLQVDH